MRRRAYLFFAFIPPVKYIPERRRRVYRGPFPCKIQPFRTAQSAFALLRHVDAISYSDGACAIYLLRYIRPNRRFPFSRPHALRPVRPPTATSVSADFISDGILQTSFRRKFCFQCNILAVTLQTTLFLSSMTSFASSLTVTIEVEENVCLSYSTVTVIFAVPTETVVTTPSDTVATALLSVFHETEVYAAPSGFTEKRKVSVFSDPQRQRGGRTFNIRRLYDGPIFFVHGNRTSI